MVCVCVKGESVVCEVFGARQWIKSGIGVRGGVVCV